MRGKQSGSGTMEEPCRAFDTKPSTTALESEPVSETDVSHGKHQTDPIQGKSSKADEHGPGPSGLRSLGKKQVEENDTVESPAEGDEEPGIEPNQTETETPVGGQRIPPQNPGAPMRSYG